MFYMKNWEQVALTMAFLFFMGCFAGWFIELFYRRFFSKNNPERKWINPGFLTGPYVPLYGFGLTVVFGMAYIPMITISDINELTWDRVLLIIIAMGLVMTFIEYIAGIVFIKHMKIKLWDYSKEWGNYQGIICPKFTVYWTLMSGLYYIFVQPHIVKLVSWYYDNIAFTFIIGMFFGIFIIDVCYSLQIGNAVRKFAEENEIVVKYEELKANIDRSKEELQDRARFTLAFVSSKPLGEHLVNYANAIKSMPENIKAVPENIKASAVATVEKIKDKID